MILLSSSIPARSAGPRLRDIISVSTTDPHVSLVLMNLLHKLISRFSKKRCQRLLDLLKSHVQLLDGHCHLLLWSRHGMLARGASRRAQFSYPERLPTVRLLRSLSLENLDTSVSKLHAFHSELSAPPDNKSRFQCSVTQSRFRSSVKQQLLLRYHVVNV